MTDIEAIRKRHARMFGDTMEPDYEADHPLASMRRTQFCSVCDGPWPCDTAQETQRADKAEAASMDDAAAIQELGRDLLASEILADALAEALDVIAGALETIDDKPSYAYAALAKGDKALDAHGGSKP